MSRSIISLALGTAIAVRMALAAGAEQPPDDTAPAQRLMAAAHRARATWEGLAGFTAELVVSAGSHRAEGTLRVTGGEVEVALPSGFEWVERRIASLVEHRQPSSGSYDVSLISEPGPHPLGHAIRIHDDSLMGSQYRIQDDVIREVHRQIGPTRFTITVLEVVRNPAGQYLPQCYSVSYWDVDTGNLERTSVVRNEWVRVGSWDLPQRLLAVETADDGTRDVFEIRFQNHRILDQATAGR